MIYHTQYQNWWSTKVVWFSASFFELRRFHSVHSLKSKDINVSGSFNCELRNSELRLIKHSSLIHDLTLIFLRHPDLSRLHSEHNLNNRLMISTFSDNMTWCCFKEIKSRTLLSLLDLLVLLFSLLFWPVLSRTRSGWLVYQQ